jgi:(1->4)-alpha-D-glucan 1-alpha-D-glucosylmutase
MLKAARESKVHTSWVTPNEDYEKALSLFIERVLSGKGATRFLPAMLPFQGRLAVLGMANSLAQTTLRLGSPGVPDFYQGTELWDLSLVDPDNRRPVDFGRREHLLADVDALLAAEPRDRAPRLTEWLHSWRDGRIKLAITAAGLRLRRDHPDLFLAGRYIPLDTDVTVRGSVVAFARVNDRQNEAAIFVSPRLCASLIGDGDLAPIGAECWKTSRIMLPPELANRPFRHVLTGAEIRPTVAGTDAWLFGGQVFETVPIGMLVAI